MWQHWLNELMNLLAGNSRYVRYASPKKILFVLALLFFIGLSGYFLYSLYENDR